MGLGGREGSKERLESQGAEAGASLGSVGLLSARAFRPARALSVGISSDPRKSQGKWWYPCFIDEETEMQRG